MNSDTCSDDDVYVGSERSSKKRLISGLVKDVAERKKKLKIIEGIVAITRQVHFCQKN